MPFDLSTFIKLRPVLYHLTHERNVDRILKQRSLCPAAELLVRAGREQDTRIRRSHGLTTSIDGEFVHLRDQSVLYEGKMSLTDGWSFDRFVEELNHRVFFWPGTERGPIDAGLNHFGRYRNESCAILVIPSAALFDENPDVAPEFCCFNSGSPRPSGGVKFPRGPSTFLPPEKYERTAGSVKEVTYRSRVSLPVHCVRITRPAEFVE